MLLRVFTRIIVRMILNFYENLLLATTFIRILISAIQYKYVVSFQICFQGIYPHRVATAQIPKFVVIFLFQITYYIHWCRKLNLGNVWFRWDVNLCYS